MLRKKGYKLNIKKWQLKVEIGGHMKRKVITGLLTTCSILSAQASFADSGHKENSDWYLNCNAEASQNSNIDLYNNLSGGDAGLENNFSVSFGYQLEGNASDAGSMRFEAEFIASVSGIGIYGAPSSSFMANAFYDIKNENGVAPYIGAGAGMAAIGNEGQAGFSNEDNIIDAAPAYQGFAGVSYISDSYPGAVMHMGYKYFATIGKLSGNPIVEPGENNFSMQNVEAGVKVNF